jgi:hypothetical protein
MTVEVTVWITPFTGLPSRQAAIDRAKQIAQSISDADGAATHPNLLLPTHFGAWPQSQCNQQLPADLLVARPADIAPIKQDIEGQGVGFGAWGVPVAVTDARAPGINIPQLAAQFAMAAGYYAANFERGVFWTPGSVAGPINQWWQGFWDTIEQAGQTPVLNGNVASTIVPSHWEMGYYTPAALEALAGGANWLCLECYGGPNTPEYPPSANPPAFDLWPAHSCPAMEQRFQHIQSAHPPLVPILALANISAQASQAVDIGHGQVQVWAI